MLNELYGDNARIRILDFLIKTRGYAYTVHEIASKTGLSVSTVYKELRELIKENLVKRLKNENRQGYYTLSKNTITELMVALVWEYEVAKI